MPSGRARFPNRSRGPGDSDSVKKRRRGLKQQVRDTKRLLARPDLPETVRQVKERVLKMMVDELQDKQRVIHDRKINKKYRMIKFFEKRKIVRKLRSHLRILSSYPEEDPGRKEIISQVHQLRADLNYIVHYPSGEKYVALFPTSSETGQKALATRDEIFKAIQCQVQDGSLSDATAIEFSSETTSLMPEVDVELDPVVGGSRTLFGSHSAITQDRAKVTPTSTTPSSVTSRVEKQAALFDRGRMRMKKSESACREQSKQHSPGTDAQGGTNKKTTSVSVTKPVKLTRKGKSRDSSSSLFACEPTLRKSKSKKRRVLAPCDDEGPANFKIQEDPFFI